MLNAIDLPMVAYGLQGRIVHGRAGDFKGLERPAVVLVLLVVGPLLGWGTRLAEQLDTSAGLFSTAWSWLRLPFAALVLVVFHTAIFCVAPGRSTHPFRPATVAERHNAAEQHNAGPDGGYWHPQRRRDSEHESPVIAGHVRGSHGAGTQ